MSDFPPKVDAARIIPLPHFNESGVLSIAQGRATVPFAIDRMFFVTQVPAGETRGSHAHRKCHQFMTCPSGAVTVFVEDGETRRTFTLDQPNQALHVPPGLWAEEVYRDPASVLVVLCDRPYEPEDYLRDKAAYLAWRRDPR